MEEVAAGLRLLGAGGRVPVVGLSGAGRLAQRPDLAMVDLEGEFPPSVSECTITADHRVVVTGTPDPSLGALLTRAAEVESVQPARVYRLTQASLARGLNDGVTADEILDALSSRARGGMPPNVVTLIEDVARRHGLVATLRQSPTGDRSMSEPEVARLAADASRRGVPVELLVEGPEGSRHLHLHHVQVRGRRLGRAPGAGAAVVEALRMSR